VRPNDTAHRQEKESGHLNFTPAVGTLLPINCRDFGLSHWLLACETYTSFPCPEKAANFRNGPDPADFVPFNKSAVIWGTSVVR
jgi:hypothetical protein